MLHVVPLVGTWIEILTHAGYEPRKVVPLVGTWIEIVDVCYYQWVTIVVPLVGTWIEIGGRWPSRMILTSCPSWARGLK